ncbi:MAG: winged helix-turn-helix transcriptional regulator [Candidatus Kariarchaeaceae archaeon]|jgi:predicted HTH transcriptional regulator
MNEKNRIKIYSEEEIQNVIKEFDEEKIDDDEWEIAENVEDFANKENEKKEQLFKIIKENPGITLEELSNLSEISVTNIEWFLEDLKKEKRIKREIRLHAQ